MKKKKLSLVLIMVYVGVLILTGCSRECTEREAKPSIMTAAVDSSKNSMILTSSVLESSAVSSEAPAAREEISSKALCSYAAPSGAVSRPTVQKSKIALADRFDFGTSPEMIFRTKDAKEPKPDKTLSEGEKEQVIRVFREKIFTPVDYPWDVKLCYDLPEYQIEINTGEKTLLFHMVTGSYAGKGYVALVDGDSFDTFCIPSESYQLLQNLG